MPEKKSISQKLMESWLWGPIGVGVSIFIGLGAVLFIFRGVLTTPGLAPGSDVPSFAHTAQYMVDYFKTNHRFPGVDLGWYAGFEISHAPPMINVFLGIIYSFTHNIYLTTRIFHPLGIGILFAGMFWLIKKEKYSTLNALLVALIFIFTPTVLSSLQSYTKLVAIMFWPFGFYLTNKVLTTTESKYLAYLAIAIGLTVYSHPMMGIVFGSMMVLYAILYAILARNIVTRRFFFVILAVAFGFLLASQYIIPFILESPRSLGIYIQHFNLGGNFAKLVFSLGGSTTLIFLAISLGIVWHRREPKFTALLFTAIVSLTIMSGYRLINLGSYFPFSSTYNYVWFFYFVFASTYILGFIVNGKAAKNLLSYLTKVTLACIFLAILIFLDNYPTNILSTLLVNADPAAYSSDTQLVQDIEKTPNDGRVYINHYPFGYLNWFLSQGSTKPNIEGHYFGITRINKQISHLGDAVDYGYPNYVFNKLKRLNTRFFVTTLTLARLRVDTTGEAVGQNLIDKIPSYGYQPVQQYFEKGNNVYSLYYLDKPSSYVMPVEEKVLIIGKYNSTLATAVSDKITAVEGNSEYLDDYDEEFLNHFETVVLYGFSYRNKAKAETITREYIKGGGNLVVELFGEGISPLAENPNFLGVTGLSQKITEPFDLANLKRRPGVLTDSLPRTFTLPGEISDVSAVILQYKSMAEWNSLKYAGLDESLIEAPNDGDNFSILGYKNVAGGKVTFVGMNFFYHAFLTHNAGELAAIDALMQNPKAEPTRDSADEAFNASQKALTPEYLKFDIESNKKRLLLISVAYSTHWKAYLNGQEIKIRNLEDLMVVEAPEGNHTLELKYEGTWPVALGWTIALATLAGLILLLIWGRRREKR